MGYYLQVYQNHTDECPQLYGSQPLPVKRTPCESFYVHLKDAPQEQWPAYVMAYRAKFNAESTEQRRQRATDRKMQLLNERVERLSARLAKVVTLGADYHAKRSQNCLATREHITEHMQQHLHRYECKQRERVDKLRAHNGQVQKRCELLRYDSYLTRIADKQDERRKRRGVF